MRLRHDNADERLLPKGRELGLIEDRDWERFNAKRDRIASIRNALDTTRFKRSSPQYAAAAQLLGTDLGDSFVLSHLAMRQGVGAEFISRLLPIEDADPRDIDAALADSMYAGYIAKQAAAAERVNHHDSLKVPENIDFRAIGGLSNEMIERLERAVPRTFGQVRTIPGVTHAALSTVLVHLTALQQARP